MIIRRNGNTSCQDVESLRCHGTRNLSPLCSRSHNRYNINNNSSSSSSSNNNNSSSSNNNSNSNSSSNSSSNLSTMLAYHRSARTECRRSPTPTIRITSLLPLTGLAV